MNYKAAMVGSLNQSSTSQSFLEPSSRGTPSETNFLPSSTMAEGSSQNIQITSHKLTGTNYLTWSQSIKLAINGRGKLGHITGAIKAPAFGDPKYSQWSSEDSMVISWLINSMEQEIGKTYMFLPTAKDVWESVKETYSDMEDQSQMLELNTKIWKLQQGNRSLTSYYNEMVSLWQEVDLFEEEAWKCSEDASMYKKKVERNRLFVFLAGLNKELDEVKGRIVSRQPLPSVKEAFSEIRREENRKKIMMSESGKNEPESSALVVKGGELEDRKGKGRGRPFCDHCKKAGHAKENCWQIHGKPAHLKKKIGGFKGGDSHAFQVSTSDQGQQLNPGDLASVKEQLEQLYRLFNSQTTPIPTVNLVQTGTPPKLALLLTKTNDLWASDSGATDHMSGKRHLFSTYKPCTEKLQVKLADGSYASVAGIGTVILTPLIVLKNVLHVPDLTYNLISVKKIARDHQCRVIFTEFDCVFQDRNSGKMIGVAREHDGLYVLETSPVTSMNFNALMVESDDRLRQEKLMLWHSRLGHPSYEYMKHVVPQDLFNKNSKFQCEICELAKQARVTFPIQGYKPTKPFHLIHSDVWGPSRIPTMNGKRWFVNFIDDHSRVTWTFFIKEKSEVSDVFQRFYKLIKTQFHSKIQIFRSDNGKEFFNQNLESFFEKKGIVHQSSCVYTPQQNGIAERKNRHLLEIARALFFTTKVSKSFWGEAVLHATYLVNRLPSKVLGFKTPLQSLENQFPNSKLFGKMPLKVFGSVVFVHDHDPTKSKLEPRAIKGIFTGYSGNKKGFKCFIPTLRKTVVSMDVTFHEGKPYYETHVQGEKSNFEHENHKVSGSVNPVDVFPVISGSQTLFETTAGSETLPQDSVVRDNSTSHTKSSSETLNGNDQGRFGSVYSRKHRTRMQTQQLQDSTRGESPESHNSNSEGNHISEFSESTSHPISDPIPEEYYLPIALRKAVRSCTKYPLANFVSYQGISPTYKSFISQSTNVFIPKNIKEALKVSEWRLAVMEEMKALEKNATWEKVKLPSGKKLVGCKWVFTVKYNSDGSLERRKARLVAKGFTQTYGLDYSETFSPVAKLNTIRILLSIATNLDWPLFQLDVKNAFLNGDLLEEVYMASPPGFSKSFGSQVCRLRKSLYGLKQSPKAWFDRFTKCVRGLGYNQGHSDHTLFIKQTANDKISILIVYVDDIILTGNDTSEIQNLKGKLAREFEIKDLGELRYFLGMEVARSKEGIVLSQRKYVLDLLKETGMTGCKPVDTPVEYNLKLGEMKEGGTPADKGRYQRLVGRLIYLSHTRPDIAYAVSMVSQFMHAPGLEHMDAVYRILRYLKGTPGKGLHFRKSESREISAYSDADWAGSPVDRRSTSGYCTFVWGNLVTWRSKKQGVVARSTAEAEFRAMAQGICELLWLKKVLQDLKFLTKGSMRLFCDNKAAIRISQNPVQHDRTKHVEIDRHFIKEKIEEGVICTPFIPSRLQVADVLTKGLMKSLFDQHLSKLGMVDIFAPT